MGGLPAQRAADLGRHAGGRGDVGGQRGAGARLLRRQLPPAQRLQAHKSGKIVHMQSAAELSAVPLFNYSTAQAAVAGQRHAVSELACLQLAALQSHLLRQLLRARLGKCRVEGRQRLGRREGLLLMRPALVHHQPRGARRRLRSTQSCCHAMSGEHRAGGARCSRRLAKAIRTLQKSVRCDAHLLPDCTLLDALADQWSTHRQGHVGQSGGGRDPGRGRGGRVPPALRMLRRRHAREGRPRRAVLAAIQRRRRPASSPRRNWTHCGDLEDVCWAQGRG